MGRRGGWEEDNGVLNVAAVLQSSVEKREDTKLLRRKKTHQERWTVEVSPRLPPLGIPNMLHCSQPIPNTIVQPLNLYPIWEEPQSFPLHFFLSCVKRVDCSIISLQKGMCVLKMKGLEGYANAFVSQGQLALLKRC